MEGWDGGSFSTNEGEASVSDNVSRTETTNFQRRAGDSACYEAP